MADIPEREEFLNAFRDINRPFLSTCNKADVRLDDFISHCDDIYVKLPERAFQHFAHFFLNQIYTENIMEGLQIVERDLDRCLFKIKRYWNLLDCYKDQFGREENAFWIFLREEINRLLDILRDIMKRCEEEESRYHTFMEKIRTAR